MVAEDEADETGAATAVEVKGVATVAKAVTAERVAEGVEGGGGGNGKGGGGFAGAGGGSGTQQARYSGQKIGGDGGLM